MYASASKIQSLIFIIEIIFFEIVIRLKGLGRQRVRPIGHENFDALLGRLQRRPTLPRQLDAGLEKLEGRFEGHFPLFELGNGLLKLIERSLKGKRYWIGVGLSRLFSLRHETGS